MLLHDIVPGVILIATCLDEVHVVQCDINRHIFIYRCVRYNLVLTGILLYDVVAGFCHEFSLYSCSLPIQDAYTGSQP